MAHCKWPKPVSVRTYVRFRFGKGDLFYPIADLNLPVKGMQTLRR